MNLFNLPFDADEVKHIERLSLKRAKPGAEALRWSHDVLAAAFLHPNETLHVILDVNKDTHFAENVIVIWGRARFSEPLLEIMRRGSKELRNYAYALISHSWRTENAYKSEGRKLLQEIAIEFPQYAKDVQWTLNAWYKED